MISSYSIGNKNCPTSRSHEGDETHILAVHGKKQLWRGRKNPRFYECATVAFQNFLSQRNDRIPPTKELGEIIVARMWIFVFGLIKVKGNMSPKLVIQFVIFPEIFFRRLSMPYSRTDGYSNFWIGQYDYFLKGFRLENFRDNRTFT